MKWTRSLLKYPGGKFGLLEAINQMLPAEKFDAYAEPFLGGASVALNIGRRFPMMLLNDGNGHVIDFWQQIVLASEEVLQHITHLGDIRSKSSDPKQKYFLVRNAFNYQSDDPAQRAAQFYYLNKEGFNGLIRYNLKGEFNVPPGRYKSFQMPDPDHLAKVSKILSNAEFESTGFEEFMGRRIGSLLKQGRKVLLYIDPPYLPLTKTSSFTSYWKPFGVAEHEALRDSLDALNSHGAKFILSNSKCGETERIFKGYNFTEVAASRTISCKKETRGAIKEYLITNF